MKNEQLNRCRMFYLRYPQISSTVSRKLKAIGLEGQSVLPKSPMLSDLFIPTPKKKQGKLVANDTVNDTVKKQSGTLNDTLNGTLNSGQIGGQIGGQMGGQIENAGICDSVNQKFETPPDIMKIRTRSYPHNNFRSLSKSNEKKFGSNQMKETGL